MQYDYTRMMIIGCAGSGKSTLAKQLGQLLDRDVFHLDKLLWQPNWHLPSFEERSVIYNSIISQNSWIMDGMWTTHFADGLTRATVVIWLDFPRMTCIRGIFSRYFKYKNKPREDRAEGCNEILDAEFVKNTWNFNKTVKPTIAKLIADSGVPTIVINTRRQQKSFVDSIANTCVK